MLKAELRKVYMQKRKALSDDEAFFLSEKIFIQFIDYFKPLPGQKVHVFVPIRKFREIDTKVFIDYFLNRNIRVFVPKVIETGLISVEIFPGTRYELNAWGISEPVSNQDSEISDFDFVITPLLYCDGKGNRVGYGKGFYDVFFEKVPEETKKIGVNYFDPVETIDDVWGHDIPLDYLVTPDAVLSFSGSSE